MKIYVNYETKTFSDKWFSGCTILHTYKFTKDNINLTKLQLIDKLHKNKDYLDSFKDMGNAEKEVMAKKYAASQAALRKANRRADEAEAKLKSIKKTIGGNNT